MANWWSKNFYTERKTAKSRYQALLAGQSNSLLQEFMDYENRPQEYQHMLLRTYISEKGEFTLSIEFNGEGTHEFLLEGDTPFDVQQDPEPFILSLYQNEEYHQLKDRFARFMATEKDLVLLFESILENRDAHEKLCERLGSRASKQTLADLDNWNRMANEAYELFQEKMHMWSETPFFVERLHASYKAFLAQRKAVEAIECVDPVEKDLMAILDNEKLSIETKDKAATLLSSYREQKSEKEVEDIDTAEQEAQLILSTIEQHYVKGGSRK